MRTNLALLGLLALVGISLPACGAKSLSAGPGSGGTGGTETGGQGGPSASGGYVGTGGGDPIGPSPDPWADGGLCSHGGQPPVNPWNFRPANPGVDTAVAGPDGGASGCVRKVGLTGATTDDACGGGAVLRTGSQGPTITWDDGSQLVWSTLGWYQSLDPPAATDGQRVWASYSDELHLPCGACGEEYENYWVSVRESDGGPFLLQVQAGFSLPDLTSDQLTALFGVDGEARATCTSQDQDGCSIVQRTIDDHLLHTTPAQVIPPDQSTTVTASTGTFEVIWYSGTEQDLGRVANCADGTASGAAFGFVASRVFAPPK